MIIYNVTVHVSHEVHDEWLNWMQNIHIPEVMECGIFNDSRILKIHTDDESGGTNYAVQYMCEAMSDYEKYRDAFSPALQKKAVNKFGDKCVSFRTILETL